ncbi:hypothetical protein AB0A73_21395 [Glycomyces sp. NPDC047369]
MGAVVDTVILVLMIASCPAMLFLAVGFVWSQGAAIKSKFDPPEYQSVPLPVFRDRPPVPDAAAGSDLQEQLRAIAAGEGFLSAQARTKALGQRLHQRSGFTGMLRAHRDIADRFGAATARELESAWDGVGDWIG